MDISKSCRVFFFVLCGFLSQNALSAPIHALIRAGDDVDALKTLLSTMDGATAMTLLEEDTSLTPLQIAEQEGRTKIADYLRWLNGSEEDIFGPLELGDEEVGPSDEPQAGYLRLDGQQEGVIGPLAAVVPAPQAAAVPAARAAATQSLPNVLPIVRYPRYSGPRPIDLCPGFGGVSVLNLW